MTLPAPILFFGIGGPLSAAPLAALLRAGASIAAVVVPAGPQQTAAIIQAPQPAPIPPVSFVPAHPRTLAEIAWNAQVPVLSVRQLGKTAVQQLASFQPAVACVSCWPARIPEALLAAPRHGFLNVHPSLLPAYRGPHPLFWALRDGLHESGVTVHWMDAELDAGDIAAQASLPFPEGVGPAVLEQAAGELGGALLVDVLQQLAAGTARRRPQPPGGSYHPAPCAEDFILDTSWPAQRAFNFLRGTAGWDYPYPVDAGSETFYLRQALGYHAAIYLPAPTLRDGTTLQVQFSPGVLLAQEWV